MIALTVDDVPGIICIGMEETILDIQFSIPLSDKASRTHAALPLDSDECHAPYNVPTRLLLCCWRCRKRGDHACCKKKIVLNMLGGYANCETVLHVKLPAFFSVFDLTFLPDGPLWLVIDYCMGST